MSVVLNFHNFLRNPQYCKLNSIKLKDIIILFLIFAVGNIILSHISYCTVVFFGFDTAQDLPPAKRYFFSAVLVAPLLEEGIFRLPLSPSKKNLLFSLCFCLASLIYFNKNIDAVIIMSIFIMFLLFPICNRRILHKFQKYILNNYKFTFYFIATLFGTLHIVRYSLLNDNWLLNVFALLLILPNIFSGIFFGYIRIKQGFFCAIIFHCMVNSVHFFLKY